MCSWLSFPISFPANFVKYNLMLIGISSLLISVDITWLQLAGRFYTRPIRYSCYQEFALKHLPDDPLFNCFHFDALYPQYDMHALFMYLSWFWLQSCSSSSWWVLNCSYQFLLCFSLFSIATVSQEHTGVHFGQHHHNRKGYHDFLAFGLWRMQTCSDIGV